MATNPEIPSPDTIEPQSPPEVAPDSPPREEPMTQPDEIEAPRRDTDEPGITPVETPPPDDDGLQINDGGSDGGPDDTGPDDSGHDDSGRAGPVDEGALGAQMGFGPIG